MLSILLLFWWFVYLSCDGVKANYAPRFECSDIADNWTVSVHNQTELDNFMEQTTLFTDTSRCIQLSLIGDVRYRVRYRLDIVKLMQINLRTSGGLIVEGTNRPVEIDCSANISNITQSKGVPKPISNTSLVLFDGLTFVRCPVPIMIEEVSTVVVKNCEFM